MEVAEVHSGPNRPGTAASSSHRDVSPRQKSCPRWNSETDFISPGRISWPGNGPGWTFCSVSLDFCPGGLPGKEICPGGLTGKEILPGGLTGTAIRPGGLTGTGICPPGLTGKDICPGEPTGTDSCPDEPTGTDFYPGVPILMVLRAVFYWKYISALSVSSNLHSPAQFLAWEVLRQPRAAKRCFSQWIPDGFEDEFACKKMISVPFVRKHEHFRKAPKHIMAKNTL